MRTHLLGREPELAVLDQCLKEVLEGHPRLVLCEGEPGIGKTRLAEELLALAPTRDALGLLGVADDSAGAPPYWPWRQILRSMDKVVDLAAVAREHELSADLAAIEPDVFASDGPPREGGSAPDRFRQYDAVGRLLGQVTRRSPVVIVFDDAHWADQPSLLLLRHLARTLRDERLLLMVNYRGTEPTPSSVVVELLREPLTRQLDLRGLPATAVGQQLALAVGYDVPDSQVQQVHALTGGNPFFAGEVGRVLATRTSANDPFPVTANVREAISARLDRLTPEAARVLRAGSVVGSQFSLGVVASMIELSATDCLAALDDAVAAGLVEVRSGAGNYRFAHALVRDAIEASLGTPEKARLHRKAAEAIEGFFAHRLEPHLFDLARHWAAAAVQGDRSRATGWIRRAAEAAMRQHAYEEGARLFRLALDSCWGEYDEESRLQLLFGLGAALYLSSDIPGGLAACGEAADLARNIGRPDLMADAALVTEPVYGLDEVNGLIRQLCESALAALGSDAPKLRARLMARFAEACDYLEDVETARPASETALALAEKCADSVVLEAALRARQLTCAGPDAVDERFTVADRMIGLGRETGSAHALMWGHLWRVDAAFQHGDFAGAARDLKAAGHSAEQVRGPLARWHVLRGRGMVAQAQARFDDARHIAEEAYAVLAPTGHPSALMMRGALLSMMGHHVGHETEAFASQNASGGTADERPGPTAPVIRFIAPAFFLFEVGRVDEAAALYRSCGPVAEWRPTQHSTLFCYANGIVLAAGLDVADDVAALRELLLPYAGHHVVSGAGPVGYMGPVDLWLGVGAAYLEQFEEAIGHLEHAAKACAVAGAPGFHAEVQYELARVLARRSGPGDLTRSRALVGDSLKQTQALGMVPIAAKCTALLEKLDDAGSAAPLSPREREVAELVAQGLTNREIAGRLYLSERTAQNHVQHILDKLALPNRGQIAVWVTNQKMSMPRE